MVSPQVCAEVGVSALASVLRGTRQVPLSTEAEVAAGLPLVRSRQRAGLWAAGLEKTQAGPGLRQVGRGLK